MKLDINGTTIEAETLKELNKLAKKEEKRQAAEEKAKAQRYDKARQEAWQQFGLLTYHLAQNVDLWFRDQSNGYMLTKSEGMDRLHVHTDNGCGVYRYFGNCIPTHLIESMSGMSRAVRFQEDTGSREWCAIGTCEGIVSLITFPHEFADRLETLLIADTEKRQAA